MRRLMLALIVVLAACGGAAPTSAPPTSAPTPTANPAWPAGDGTVTFGTAFSEDTFTITKPTSRFSRKYSGKVWFIASFSEAPAASSLTFTLTRLSGATEALLWSIPAQISDPRVPMWGNGQTLAELSVTEPGTYVMRFARDATVLAERTFTVS